MVDRGQELTLQGKDLHFYFSLTLKDKSRVGLFNAKKTNQRFRKS